MLMSLCLNSLEAMKEFEERYLVIMLGETTVPKTSRSGLPPGEYAHVTVMDHGVGMVDEMRKKAFEPFFSTSQGGIGEGMGLGLAMSQEIMKKHGGHIALTSLPDCGTIVHLYFPVVESE